MENQFNIIRVARLLNHILASIQAKLENNICRPGFQRRMILRLILLYIIKVKIFDPIWTLIAHFTD